MTEKIQVEIKLFGKTKTVEATKWRDDLAETGLLFSARCGRTGEKVWPATVKLWLKKDGSWKTDLQFDGLNRNTGRVHSWAEDCPWTADNGPKMWQERFDK